MKLNLTPRILIVALIATIACARLMSHAQEPPRRVEVVAKRFEFTPSEITLKKGEPVVIVLTSKDFQHGLKFAEFNHSPVLIPIPGTSSVKHLEENMAAAKVQLSDAEWKAIEEAA